MFLLRIAPWACLDQAAPPFAPAAAVYFSSRKPAATIGWEGPHPGGFWFFGSCIFTTRMNYSLDCMLVREWLGKANDYGGAKDHELPFGSPMLVHMFELAIANT